MLKLKSAINLPCLCLVGSMFLIQACGSDSDDDSDQTPVANLSLSATFAKKCASCHGENGEGGVGKRLYKHTESWGEFLETVRNGKGSSMPATPSSEYSDEELRADFDKLQG